ncbi:MAG TPA: glycosyltransferase [Streptosporangiales bacterium]
MRVLVIHNRYRSAAPSGENRVVDQESEALAARGHDVERFEYHSDDIDGWPAARKATLPARVVWNPAARRDLAATLRRFAPDVAHVHNTFPLLTPAVLHACRDARVPVVATLHNYKLLCASGDFFRAGAVCHDCAGGSLAPALRHRCYRGSAAATAPIIVGNVVHRRAWRELVSAYVFISAEQRRLMAGLRISPERAFVKPNFVPYAPLPDVPTRRQVAYVGRLDAAKGVPLLLAGWDRYRADAGDGALRLVVAGDGPLGDEVRRWAADRPSVEVLGHLTRAECRDTLAASRAALLPSQWEETFGLVVVEAMAAGVPAVAAAHGSFPELVTEGRDGVLFRPGDADDLARALHEVDRDPERLAAYGREARRTYERRFDVQANVDQLLDIYEFAVRNPTRLAA